MIKSYTCNQLIISINPRKLAIFCRSFSDFGGGGGIRIHLLAKPTWWGTCCGCAASLKGSIGGEEIQQVSGRSRPYRHRSWNKNKKKTREREKKRGGGVSFFCFPIKKKGTLPPTRRATGGGAGRPRRGRRLRPLIVIGIIIGTVGIGIGIYGVK